MELYALFSEGYTRSKKLCTQTPWGVPPTLGHCIAVLFYEGTRDWKSPEAYLGQLVFKRTGNFPVRPNRTVRLLKVRFVWTLAVFIRETDFCAKLNFKRNYNDKIRSEFSIGKCSFTVRLRFAILVRSTTIRHRFFVFSSGGWSPCTHHKPFSVRRTRDYL